MSQDNHMVSQLHRQARQTDQESMIGATYVRERGKRYIGYYAIQLLRRLFCFGIQVDAGTGV